MLNGLPPEPASQPPAQKTSRHLLTTKTTSEEGGDDDKKRQRHETSAISTEAIAMYGAAPRRFRSSLVGTCGSSV